jgi:phage protein D
MQLIYEEVDITKRIHISKADIIDNAGGTADSIELWLSDVEGLWSQWKPKKDDTIRVIQDGFSSGIMYVDELEQQRGTFIIRALSIPQRAKTDTTRAWESIRFLELSTELARKYGFSLQSYGVENYFYERLDQFEEADFKFLLMNCILEGCTLKLSDNKVIIYNESYMEKLDAIKTIYSSSFDGNYRFYSKASGIYSTCKLSYDNIKCEFTPSIGPQGPALKRQDIFLSSQENGERYAKNLLRFYNKYENTGEFTIKLDTDIAAGNNLNISGLGIADGKYFCDKVIHKLVEEKTFLKLRKTLEVY